MVGRSAYFVEMMQSAQAFCALIETINRYEKSEWFTQLARILPRIHWAIVNLDDRLLKHDYATLPDLEERFELYCRLKARLGDYDEYWLELDCHANEADKSGSLADDLTDLYFELKRGLKLCQSTQGSDEEALKLWLAGYVLHWGQHLVDAQKHLYSLRIQNKF